MRYVARTYTVRSKRLGLLVYTEKGVFDGLALAELSDVSKAPTELRAKILADVKRRETMPRDKKTWARLRAVSDLIFHADRASRGLDTFVPVTVELTDDVRITIDRIPRMNEAAHDVDVILRAAREMLKEFA